ncbi:rhodanese-like domain-containing protein [Fulvivirga maritima]|uniref:rhodanese-like domain-containing protein n=1 Tax=Fulvivirga maritima TaxID=2904247 RepID=UPI001F32088D|nr:rhodanese-like domain-containing protein [Fulvivirga maritima]UII26715.1 rhodanese-like domain-containing protein [Fulvivirga maritima]
MFAMLKNMLNPVNDGALKKAIDEGAFLVDVRTPGEFAGGSVVGAVNIPLNTVGDQLKKFDGKNKIVVFCQSGNRSMQAQNVLEHHGFHNIINGGSWLHVNKVKNG